MCISFALKDGCKQIYILHKAGLGLPRYVITRTSWWEETITNIELGLHCTDKFLFSAPHAQSWSCLFVYVLILPSIMTS